MKIYYRAKAKSQNSRNLHTKICTNINSYAHGYNIVAYVHNLVKFLSYVLMTIRLLY